MTTKALAACVALALNFYVYHYMATEQVTPERRSFDRFPLQLGDWRCPETQDLDDKVLRTLGATDYLVCTFRNPEKNAIADLYVGYHATQVREEGGAASNSIHPPEHCLPGAGWDIIDARTVPLDLPGLPKSHGLFVDEPHAKRFVIAKGDARQLVYFWYQSRGRVLSGNMDVILFRFWDRAWRHRTDGSLVRVTVPIRRGDEQRAEREFREFASYVTPTLGRYVPE